MQLIEKISIGVAAFLGSVGMALAAPCGGLNRISGYTDVVALGKGETNLTVDIGVVQRLANLGDKVWFDSNKNGQQDLTERGVAGVSVTLFNAGADNVFGTADDIMVATQTTDANGNYLFRDLNAGQYQVLFAPTGDLQFTKSNTGVDATDSDANTLTGRSHVVTLVVGQTDLTVDAGLHGPELTRPDEEELCENSTRSFNVLANDTPGLKLISVAHETAALDSAFNAAGGTLTFTQDGSVTYRSKTDGFGADKLIYVAEDANGQRYTQTVDIDINGAKVTSTISGGHSWGYAANMGETVVAGTAGAYYGLWHTVTLNSTSSITAADGPNTSVLYQIHVNQVDAATAPSFLRLANGTVVAADQNGDFWVRSTGPSMEIWQFRQWGAGPNGTVYSHQNVSTTAWLGEFDAGGNLLKYHCPSSKNTCVTNTPLVLDLNGDGVHTLGVDQGVEFDFLGTGVAQATGWVDRHDGLLALDRNGDGKINNGTELFGDATKMANGATAFDGFEALADFDGNHDGKIDANDSVFSKLQLWVDANSNGETDMGELVMLAQMGVNALNLAAVAGAETQSGNTLGLVSSYVDNQGQSHEMADVWFNGSTRVPPLSSLVDTGEPLDQVLGAPAPATVDVFAQCFTPETSAMADVLRKMVSAHAAMESATA